MKPWHIAVGYVAAGALAAALVAMPLVPLWQSWAGKISGFRDYVSENMPALADLMQREGPAAVASAVRKLASELPNDRFILFAGPGNEVLAGTLREWPVGVPEEGTPVAIPDRRLREYRFDTEVGGELVSLRVAQEVLPGGYRLLMARKSVPISETQDRFIYGIAGSLALLISLGGAVAWLLARRTAAVRRSEERYERVMLAAQAGFWEWDVAKDEFVVSERLLEMSELPPGATFSGRADFMRRAPFHPEDRQKWQQAVKQLFASGGTRLVMDIRSMRKDGSFVWQRIEGMCFRDAAGNVTRWTGSAVDIDARKRAEEELRESETRFRGLMDLWSDWYWRQDEDLRFTYSSAAIDPPEGYPGGSAIGKTRWELADIVPLTSTWAEHRQLLEDRKPFRDFEYSRPAPDGSLRYVSTSGTPVFDEKGEFRGYHGIARDITGRKRSEEALRISEERYSLAVDGASQGIFDWDIASGRVFHSRRAQEFFGIEVGEPWRSRREWAAVIRYHPDDVSRISASLRAHLNGEKPICEDDFRVVTREGEVRWLRQRGVVMRDASGKAYRMAGSIEDVTERKRVEGKLREQTERLQLGQAAMRMIIMDWNVAEDLLTWSDSPEWLRGPMPASGRYPPFKDQVHPEDRDEFLATRSRALETMQVQTTEFRLVRTDGEVIWVLERKNAFAGPDGKAVRMLSAMVDITVHKRGEEALRVSKERYALAVAGSDDGVWDIDFVADKVFLSARARELAGLPPGPEVVSRDEWFSALPLHPEDVPRRAAAVEAHLSGQAPAYVGEFRLRQADGAYRWRRLHGLCLRDAAGKPARMAGSISDVDARKCAEDALRMSEERYALALEAAEEGHFDYDIRTGALFISDRLNEIYGFASGAQFHKRSEFMSRVPFYGEDGEKYHDTIRALEAKDGPERYEFEYRIARPSGEIRWLMTRAKVIRNAKGDAIRRTGVIADITERKLAVEALRISEERYSLALEATDEGHFDVDLETGEIFASARLNEIYGFPRRAETTDRAEYLKRIPFHPDDRHLLADISNQDWNDPARVSRLERYALRIVPRPGETRWIQVHAMVVRDAQGRARRRVGVVTDITDQKRAEGLLAGEKQLLEMMARAAPLPKVLDTLCRIVEENLAGFLCGILLVDASGTRLVLGAAPSLPREYLQAIDGAVIDPDTGPCGMSTFTKEQVISTDVAAETRWVERGWCALALSHGFRSCWSTPIVSSAKKSLGAFGLYTGQPGSPTGLHHSVIERFTHLAAVAIEHSRDGEARQLSEERYELAMRASGEGHWDWKIPTGEFYVSPRYLELLGLPPDTRFSQRSDFVQRLPFHPGDRAAYEAAVAAHFAGETPSVDMVIRVLPHGKLRWLHVIGMCLRDVDGKPVRWAGSVSDVTDRKNAVDKLRESDARFRALVELNAGGFWEQDENFRYLPSTYLQHITGYPNEYRVGKTRWELPGDLTPLSGSWDEHKADLEAHRPFRDFEYRRTRPDGRTGYYSASGMPIFDGRGRFKGYYGVVSDITERKRFEEDLRRAQSMEALGTLAGGIAHDFNNILGAILGYGEMAMRGAKAGSRLRRDLDSILAAGERGRALVDRVLAFSRSGVADRVPVHVEAVVREALDQVAASLPGNVAVVPRLRAGRAAMLGDSTQVHQVVMNLASNAVQAMPEGGVLRVHLETARYDEARMATVGAIASGDYIVLRVSDTGTGIPDNVLDRVFAPFFTTKEIGVGSGLGLSLVHGIVTSVDGAIDVATEPGKGTTFTVYLRRTGNAADKPANDRRPLPRGEGQRVLVVDDEEPLVRLATETLERLGYAPVGFTSSAAALAAFRADPARFDAVLTDERMPGMSGTALIREVRGIRDAIPVVLMSGYLGMESVDADVVVRKPLSARDLAASMERALQA